MFKSEIVFAIVYKRIQTFIIRLIAGVRPFFAPYKCNEGIDRLPVTVVFDESVPAGSGDGTGVG